MKRAIGPLLAVFTLAALSVGAAGAAIAATGAAAGLDPNWPCQQIKIEHMSLATFWGGPPLGKFVAGWQNYPAAAALAGRLSERRIPLGEATAEIKSFAKNAGKDSETGLLALMGGLFARLDQERFEVIAGLDRFGARQKSYAAQIRGEITALHAAEDATAPDQKAIGTLSSRVYWDTRVFADRRDMVSYACFVPDAIEQRLYRLAGVISNLLP